MGGGQSPKRGRNPPPDGGGYRDGLAWDADVLAWRCRRQVRGRIHKASFRARSGAHAQVAAAKVRALDWLGMMDRLAAGLPVESAAPTLTEAWASYLRRLQVLERSELTATYYARMRAALEGGLGAQTPLGLIDQVDVEGYVATRRRPGVDDDGRPRRGVGPGTVTKELRALETVYRHVKVRPKWSLPPLSHHPKERQVRTPAEVARLWLELEPEVLPAVGLCLLAGLRASEAYAATSEWLRREEGELLVRLRKTGGWNRTALVGMLAEVLPGEGPLVTLGEGQVRAALARGCRRAGLSPAYAGVGAFRHHCGTWAHELGHSREEVGLVLGHSRPGATGRYLHSQAVVAKRRVLEAVEELFKAAVDEARRARLRAVG